MCNCGNEIACDVEANEHSVPCDQLTIQSGLSQDRACRCLHQDSSMQSGSRDTGTGGVGDGFSPFFCCLLVIR